MILNCLILLCKVAYMMFKVRKPEELHTSFICYSLAVQFFLLHMRLILLNFTQKQPFSTFLASKKALK